MTEKPDAAATDTPKTGIEAFRHFVFDIVEISGESKNPRLSWYFDVFIMVLILLNVAAVMLATVKSIGEPHRHWFALFESFSVTIFTAEYLARLWSCTIKEEFRHPFWGRLSFATGFFPMIDLLAILPTLGLLGAWQTRQLRIARLLRFLRVLKLGRYSNSTKTLFRVLRSKKEELLIAVFMVCLLLLFSSTCIYYCEKDSQPDKFSSIPASMWWGVATLTTVGYGDVYPITPLGKFFAAIIAVLGVGVFALPAGILASGFSDVLEEQKKEKMGAATLCPHCGLDIHSKAETHGQTQEEKSQG